MLRDDIFVCWKVVYLLLVLEGEAMKVWMSVG